jgi:hypothetical protein
LEGDNLDIIEKFFLFRCKDTEIFMRTRKTLNENLLLICSIHGFRSFALYINIASNYLIDDAAPLTCWNFLKQLKPSCVKPNEEVVWRCGSGKDLLYGGSSRDVRKINGRLTANR